MRTRNVGRIIGAGVAALVVLIITAIILNVGVVQDYIKSATYKPNGEMVQIRDALNLTDAGLYRFNVAQPQLSNTIEFNEICRQNQDMNVAVLGCYTGGNIYVYNIDEKELAGIRELTAAHELLHAVWANMSDSERQSLAGVLDKVLADNAETLNDELSVYGTDEKQEELYVRAGTEIADLPAELEKHYAEIFKDQDAIVEFYNSYIGVFLQIENEMSNLKSEMDTIAAEVDAKKSEYEARVGQFEAEVAEFNDCANTVGCFVYESEFYVRRNILLAEQDALTAMYDEINALIREYNAKVEAYNADAMHGEKLQQMINSAAETKKIE